MRSTTRAKLTAMIPFFAVAATIAILAAGTSARGQNPASAPASAPATQPQAALDPTVDKILTRLETREIHDLRAKVTWTLRYVVDLEGEETTKNGELWYQQQQPVARFLVHFTKKLSAGRIQELDERYMFDGRWYTELKSETKTYTRSEIRREGDVGNPYKIGEGPFPVPFGQKKADILKEFDVSLIAPAAGDPEGTDHLKLDPREGANTRQTYKQVDLWVAREGPQSGLPVKVLTAKKQAGKVNSYITITFTEPRLNEGFSGSVFECKPPPGYDVQEETLDPIQPPESTQEPAKTP